MPSPQPARAELDERRRRIKFRASHRGMRELDLLLGGFADAALAALDTAEIEAFEGLLEAEDQDVYGWLTGEIGAPPPHDTPLLARIRAFHRHAGPIHV
jgi:antitoxin CptB